MMRKRTGRACLGAMLATAGLTGCVTVKAPDKPIVIELNITIRQEVIYRLDSKARDVIEQESGIF